MKKLVIIPTYNELENIGNIVPAIYDRLPEVHILVVDDSSPDGTGEKVKELQNAFPNTHLLVRAKKEGLGKAYIAGFKWGLEQGFDIICEMDADFLIDRKIWCKC
ncbi:MAG: glycosyltransferase [Bdellovibrionales bacterium]